MGKKIKILLKVIKKKKKPRLVTKDVLKKAKTKKKYELFK